MNPSDLTLSLIYGTNAIFGTVFLLGMKHGFDADHLAAIDSLTRVNSGSHPRLSKWIGILFSLGHGAIVLVAALCVSMWVSSWLVPLWMEKVGSWVSIGLLLMLAGANVAMVLRSSPSVITRITGWQSVVFARLFSAGNASTAFAVGALFALSYDTLSFAAFFGLVASRSHGFSTALLLGGIFVIGMLVTDGLNGVVVANLISRSEKNAYITSLVMALAVAAAGLCTALFGIAKQCLPADSRWMIGAETWLGVAVFGSIVLSFFVGIAVARYKTLQG